ncbi:hypothetical protein B0I33_108194 [Prauserella shujinwangii]|uniref:Uncharacterized protein n=1 Tax=Prauserella shujinwangii TaxID=1453103 RepID=A0A2T0LRC9_9PSEU|nr:hypothetical protein [Prauserella shujinwangii]PRX46047.1 hypothetical protein B0I33_108194 [Prauserella shujinwangii]
MTETPEAGAGTVAAVGKLTEAFEAVEIARGHLYAFHRLTGTADFTLEQAIAGLDEAGHGELAARLSRELLGRNVLPGRWTYQVVEEYDELYYTPFRELAEAAWELTGGRRHAHEAGLKRRRRTPGEPGHEAEPDEPAARG